MTNNKYFNPNGIPGNSWTNGLVLYGQLTEASFQYLSNIDPNIKPLLLEPVCQIFCPDDKSRRHWVHFFKNSFYDHNWNYWFYSCQDSCRTASWFRPWDQIPFEEWAIILSQLDMEVAETFIRWFKLKEMAEKINGPRTETS